MMLWKRRVCNDIELNDPKFKHCAASVLSDLQGGDWRFAGAFGTLSDYPFRDFERHTFRNAAMVALSRSRTKSNLRTAFYD